MIKAIIVDDELRSREVLRRHLLDYCSNVQLLGEAKDVASAIRLIHATQPDVVFLDIEMPEKNGFELMTHFQIPGFEVIFTTAHQNYAIQALRASAIDYLLKPINIDQLFSALERVEVKKRLQSSKEKDQRMDLLQQNLNPSLGIQKLALPNTDGMLFIKKKELYYLEAERAYTRVVSSRGKTMVSKPLRFFEDMLQDDYFFRTHRSFLVNLHYVHRLVRKDGGYIEMLNGDQVSLANHLKEQFVKAVQLYA